MLPRPRPRFRPQQRQRQGDGYEQRRAGQFVPPQAPPPSQSHEFHRLMDLCMLGLLSAFACQQIGEGHVMDGNQTPQMVMLSRLGSNGQYPASCWRDLERRLGYVTCNIPKATVVKLPLLDRSKHPHHVVWTDWPIFLGQDLMHSLYWNHQAEFQNRFSGGEGRLQEFWAGMEPTDPRLHNHPCKSQANWQQRAIPGRLHGDGVPYGKAKDASADVISWSSKLARGDIFDTLNLWLGLPKGLLCNQSEHGVDTMREVWKVVVWDMWVMANGEFQPQELIY